MATRPRKVSKVPLYGNPNKTALLEDGATVGATLGLDLWMPDGSLATAAKLAAYIGAAATSSTSGSGVGGLSATLWSLIQEIPENVLQVAALATAGLVVRQASGSWITRAIAVASTDRLTITDGDGDAGAPTLDLADLEGLAVWGNAGNTSAKPDAITGTANQVLRVNSAGTALAFGQVNLASAAAITGRLPFTNLTQGSSTSVLAVAGGSTADFASLQAAADDRLLARTGGTLAFVQLTAGMFPNAVIPDAALSSNVPLLNVANTFTASGQTVSSSTGTLLVLSQTGTSFALLRYNRNGSAAGFVGFADGSGGVVTGAAAGDLVLRGDSNAGLIFSADAGSSITWKFAASVQTIFAPASTAAQVRLAGNGNTAGSTSFDVLQNTDNFAYVYNRANAGMIFGTNNTDRVIITSGGATQFPGPFSTGFLAVLSVEIGTSSGEGYVQAFDRSGGGTYKTLNLSGDAVKVRLSGGTALVVATIESGSFTATLTGMTSSTTGTIQWRRTGNKITLMNGTGGPITGTSNAATMTMTGISAAIQPATGQAGYSAVIDNSVLVPGGAAITGGTIVFASTALGGFAAAGTKGIPSNWSYSYELA